MPTVYVINRASHDFSKAKKHGELCYLSNDPMDRYATNNMYRQFKEILEARSPDDYILVTSLTIMNVVACSMFAKLHGKVNLLIHKTENNDYIVRRLDLSDLGKELKNGQID